MGQRILIIDGHPDPDSARFGHALARDYADGARRAGHEVSVLTVADIQFRLLRSAAEWQSDELEPAI